MEYDDSNMDFGGSVPEMGANCRWFRQSVLMRGRSECAEIGGFTSICIGGYGCSGDVFNNIP
jgi:hypothetical protein